MREWLYYKRGNQFWKHNRRTNEILMINLPAPNKHYNGDAHIFMKYSDFNEDGSQEITKYEFDKIREQHLKRLMDF